ncbi:MAG: ferredoxin family protein [bacterium]|nr:ferredoxin family protein [bacterium]
MTFIIAEPCVDTKDRACVEVCPVDCIYEYVEASGGFVVPDPSTGAGTDKTVVPKVGGTVHTPSEKLTKDQLNSILFVHPEECIDCGACESACPVTAIFAEADVPEKWKQFTDLNYDAFGVQRK